MGPIHILLVLGSACHDPTKEPVDTAPSDTVHRDTASTDTTAHLDTGR